MFAINQDDSSGTFAAMDELDDGRTLAQVIELSGATKVILDKETVAPLRRLWCLDEIGATPSAKLHLVTRGFSEREIAQHLQSIDAETALCFSDSDREMIREEIVQRFDSLARFTEELRLRFLLRPLGYEADVAALSRRSTGDVFAALRAHMDAPLEAASPQVAERSSQRLACVVGEAGEGKSTVSAALLGCASAGPPIHAAHFFKRTDALRQDPLAIVRSLSYQLAQRFDEVRSAVLGIGPEAAGLAQVDLDTAQKELLVLPLHALAAAGRNAVLLVDALDEATEEQRARAEAVARHSAGKYWCCVAHCDDTP